MKSVLTTAASGSTPTGSREPWCAPTTPPTRGAPRLQSCKSSQNQNQNREPLRVWSSGSSLKSLFFIPLAACRVLVSGLRHQNLGSVEVLMAPMCFLQPGHSKVSSHLRGPQPVLGGDPAEEPGGELLLAAAHRAANQAANWAAAVLVSSVCFSLFGPPAASGHAWLHSCCIFNKPL